jgi:TonB family protein
MQSCVARVGNLRSRGHANCLQYLWDSYARRIKSHNPEEKALIARCSPRIIKKKPKIVRKAFQVRVGENPTGFSPLISFQITESGEVINARVKRSSGIRDEDNAALDSIRSGRYNSRPACPFIDSESSVTIDLSAAN